MTHPLLDLIANRPQLLADHAQAYGELMASEMGAASSALARRAALGLGAAILLAVGAVLAGIAVMLWAVVPVNAMVAPWALLVVPLLPLIGGVVCLIAARLGAMRNPFDKIWWQVKADVAMLREATPS